jgi:hypothetical protein
VSFSEYLESLESFVIQEWLLDRCGQRRTVGDTTAACEPCRRLAKDCENLNCKALAFLRLANPPYAPNGAQYAQIRSSIHDGSRSRAKKSLFEVPF